MNQETIQIAVPKNALVTAFLEKMARASGPAEFSTLRPASPDTPAIGAPYLGGLYAGATIDPDGGPSALILLPEAFAGDWKAANAWAAKRDATLPSRIDALVLFKNLKKEFEAEYYWTAESVAHDHACAWIQSFTNGSQYDYHEGYEYRARAVRRVAI